MHLGAFTLRDDPFGYPFAIVGGAAVSIGLETNRARHRLDLLNLRLSEIAARDGRWPRTLDEARAAGAEVPDLPPGGHYRMAGHQVAIDWDPPPGHPWPLREMLRAP
jgi:hypothetical protein